MIEWYKQADRALKGLPDHLLTVILLLIAGLCLVVATSDKSALKGIVVAWMVLP